MIEEIDLIAAIYDAILDPSGWDEVVKRIAEATKSVAGFIAVRRRDAGDLSALFNADPFYADLFNRHYYKINPLNAAGAAIAPCDVRSAVTAAMSPSNRLALVDRHGAALLLLRQTGGRSWRRLLFSRSALIMSAPVIAAALLAFATPAGAKLATNKLAANGILRNGVPPNARITIGSALGDLNGVAVEAVILPDTAIR